MAVNTLMVASRELAQVSHTINPSHPKDVTFGNDFKELAIEGLSDKDNAQVAATRLCNIYGEFLDSANEALLTSDNVVAFIAALYERTERKKTG